jgi:hypothetical protein
MQHKRNVTTRNRSRVCRRPIGKTILDRKAVLVPPPRVNPRDTPYAMQRANCNVGSSFFRGGSACVTPISKRFNNPYVSLDVDTRTFFSHLSYNEGREDFNHLINPRCKHWLCSTLDHINSSVARSLVVYFASWLLPAMTTSAPTAADVDDDALLGASSMSSSTLHVNHLVATYGYPAIRLVIALIVVYMASGVSS